MRCEEAPVDLMIAEFMEHWTWGTSLSHEVLSDGMTWRMTFKIRIHSFHKTFTSRAMCYSDALLHIIELTESGENGVEL